MPHQRLKPYIGITDFTDESQVRSMRARFCAAHAAGVEPGRQLMVGVMMSFKTLHDLPTKWANAWPHRNELRNIFQPIGYALNTLHYADFDGDTRDVDIVAAATVCGPFLNAVQLDMIWPAPALLDALRRTVPNDVRCILQINERAFEEIGNDPGQLLQRLERYAGLHEGVLLDKSMGKGKGLDARWLLPFVEVLAEQRSDLTVGVAGGLGPDTLELLEPLKPFFPILSIDAQGQLRQSGSSLDPIDWQRAGDYVFRAVRYLR